MPDRITRERLDAVLAAVVDGHEVLRCRFDRDAMALVAQPKTDILSEVWVSGELVTAVAEQTLGVLASLDPRPADCSRRCGCANPTGPVFWC